MFFVPWLVLTLVPTSTGCASAAEQQTSRVRAAATEASPSLDIGPLLLRQNEHATSPAVTSVRPTQTAGCSGSGRAHRPPTASSSGRRPTNRARRCVFLPPAGQCGFSPEVPTDERRPDHPGDPAAPRRPAHQS